MRQAMAEYGVHGAVASFAFNVILGCVSCFRGGDFLEDG